MKRAFAKFLSPGGFIWSCLAVGVLWSATSGQASGNTAIEVSDRKASAHDDKGKAAGTHIVFACPEIEGTTCWTITPRTEAEARALVGAAASVGPHEAAYGMPRGTFGSCASTRAGKDVVIGCTKGAAATMRAWLTCDNVRGILGDSTKGACSVGLGAYTISRR